MDSKEQLYFISMLKSIADENRLEMLRIVAKQGRSIPEIAQIMELPESVVVQCANQLHANGFLRVSMLNNQRIYHFKPEPVTILQGYIPQLGQPLTESEKPVSDNRWIDELDMLPEEKAILVKWTFNGRLTDFPTKGKEWRVILRWIVTKFEANMRYTEKQVNEVIKTHIHDDYATIRRSLIEDGFMNRERGGAEYWLNV